MPFQIKKAMTIARDLVSTLNGIQIGLMYFDGDISMNNGEEERSISTAYMATSEPYIPQDVGERRSKVQTGRRGVGMDEETMPENVAEMSKEGMTYCEKEQKEKEEKKVKEGQEFDKMIKELPRSCRRRKMILRK